MAAAGSAEAVGRNCRHCHPPGAGSRTTGSVEVRKGAHFGIPVALAVVDLAVVGEGSLRVEVRLEGCSKVGQVVVRVVGESSVVLLW